MRSVRLRKPGGLVNLEFAVEDVPSPKVGEILVRITANSLNFHDLMVVLGHIACADRRVPMTDGAGEVIAIGDGVEGFRPGDVVVSRFYPNWLGGKATPAATRGVPGEAIDGYAREYVCMPEQAFTKAPAGYTALEAATLTCAGVTAWRGLMVAGQVMPGETVLVLGTGGVSLFALQLAKAAGARVIATSSSDEKLEKLKRLGADEVINYKAEPNWGARAKELTDGCGVDHVVEVGGAATLQQSIAACKMGAHIAMIGLLTGVEAGLSIPAVFSQQIRISGISVGSKADQENMIRAITACHLKPILDRTFHLQDLADAFAYYESQKHFGKVCVQI